MTVPAYVKFNSRERALSTDQNRQAILSRRALAEAMAALSSGTLRQSGCFGASFLVTPQAGTMKSSIVSGIALSYDSTAVFPYSTISWIESSTVREVTHDTGDGNPRFDVVEMRAGSATTLTQPRDEFNPVTGSFSVVNMAKEVASYPEFQVRKGSPAVVPSIPAGTAGWMPLAYVLVPAGALQLLANNVIYCRPILDAQPGRGWVDPTQKKYATGIRGGGLNVSNGGVNTIAASMSGRFPGHHHDFRIDAGAEARYGTLVYDGGGAPAVTSALYFYAIPPPYPAGYDASMAPRELWTPDQNSFFGGDGGFVDSTLQEGCIIVGSTTAPSINHPTGHPTSGAAGSINHTFFSSAASSLDRSKWVYIGAASYDQLGPGTTKQITVGSTVATTRKTGFDFTSILPVGADTAANMWSEISVAEPVRWPVTAQSVTVQLYTTIAASGYLTFAAIDELSNSTSPQGWHRHSLYNPSAGALTTGMTFPVRTNASGAFTLKTAAHVNATLARVVARDYKDQVLAMRMG